MDLWVVVAAAGAGYISKYWQNLLKEKEGSSDSFVGNSVNNKTDSVPSLDTHLNQNCDQSSLFRRRTRRQVGKEFSLNIVEGSPNSNGLSEEIASTNGVNCETMMNSGYQEGNVHSLMNLQPQILTDKDHQDEVNRINRNNEFAKKTCYGFSRSRRSLHSKWSRRYTVKPLSSLDSCLIAQIYKEQLEMEEYVLSSLPSPSKSTIRPFFITDGSQIISKAITGPLQFEVGEHKLPREDGSDSKEKENMIGISPLREAGLIELTRKTKLRRGKVWDRRLSIPNTQRSGKHFHSQGSSDGMHLFFLGIGFGVMSTILSNKREVDKLNELLKKTENLVQDLQEELEMKDSLTVKELANEACDFQEITYPLFSTKDPMNSFLDQASNVFLPNEETDDFGQYDDRELSVEKAVENSESISKIEAELEAELERLELNMNASNLERRLSALSELDPDFSVDIVHGELKAEILNGGVKGQSDSDQDKSSTSTTRTQPTNLAISPRELSIRLHELIQSRQQERIMELEKELKQSRKQLHLMELEQMNFQRDFSNSERASSSNQESPPVIEQGNVMAHPVFLNLSGEALDAYNEAYEEFSRASETEDENPPSTVCCNSMQIKEGCHPFDQDIFQGQAGGCKNGYLKMGEREPRRSFHDKIGTWERISRSRGSNEFGEFEDGDNDDEDDNDELGKLLIKQIVEKTRQGSPVVLNAQRMLFSMDE